MENNINTLSHVLIKVLDALRAAEDAQAPRAVVDRLREAVHRLENAIDPGAAVHIVDDNP